MIIIILLIIFLAILFLWNKRLNPKINRILISGNFNFNEVYGALNTLLKDRSSLADYNYVEFLIKSNITIDMPINSMIDFNGLGELYKWAIGNGYTSFRLCKLENDIKWENKTCGDIAIFCANDIKVESSKEQYFSNKIYISHDESEYEIKVDGETDIIELYKPVYGNKIKVDVPLLASTIGLPTSMISDFYCLYPQLDIFTELDDFNVLCLNVIHQARGVNFDERLKRRKQLLKHILPEFVEILGDPLSNCVNSWYNDIAEESHNCYKFLENISTKNNIKNDYDETVYNGEKISLVINVYNNYYYSNLLKAIENCGKVKNLIVAGNQEQFKHLSKCVRLESDICSYYF